MFRALQLGKHVCTAHGWHPKEWMRFKNTVFTHPFPYPNSVRVHAAIQDHGATWCWSLQILGAWKPSWTGWTWMNYRSVIKTNKVSKLRPWQKLNENLHRGIVLCALCMITSSLSPNCWYGTQNFNAGPRIENPNGWAPHSSMCFCNMRAVLDKTHQFYNVLHSFTQIWWWTH